MRLVHTSAERGNIFEVHGVAHMPYADWYREAHAVLLSFEIFFSHSGTAALHARPAIQCRMNKQKCPIQLQCVHWLRDCDDNNMAKLVWTAAALDTFYFSSIVIGLGSRKTHLAFHSHHGYIYENWNTTKKSARAKNDVCHWRQCDGRNMKIWTYIQTSMNLQWHSFTVAVRSTRPTVE